LKKFNISENNVNYCVEVAKVVGCYYYYITWVATGSATGTAVSEDDDLWSRASSTITFLREAP
jgi:hypothetical protein